MNDERGTVRAMGNALADAPECADTMQAARTQDQEVGMRRTVAQGGEGMPRIPRGDALGPGTLAFDRLPTRRRHNLQRRTESLGQVIGDGKCCERELRAVNTHHDAIEHTHVPIIAEP